MACVEALGCRRVDDLIYRNCFVQMSEILGQPLNRQIFKMGHYIPTLGT